VDVLRGRGHAIDIYVAEAPPRVAPGVRTAHDFVWRHAQGPYDLNVYQFGNSSHHDYVWPYALRYPGLVALHDTHLHHARAAALMRDERAADYRAEFAFGDPSANRDLAELAIHGFDSPLYYRGPLIRTLAATARLVITHGDEAAAELRSHLEDAPQLAARVSSVALGEGRRLDPAAARVARASVRARHGISSDALVFGVFGGIAPEKRIDQILDAFEAIVPAVPSARLLLAGASAPHYDVTAALAARGPGESAIVTGYLRDDEEVTNHLAACDVTLNLRWPTARETSGPWLRALAMERPTIITDLLHLRRAPSIDPRTWQRNQAADPICVAVDVLDEEHSLRLAMRRLGTDPTLRESLGRAAVEWWSREHTVDRMADDYERAMEEARHRPPPDGAGLPAHLRDASGDTLESVAAPFGPGVSERIRALSGD
jgi:glycosyltransferase involved in cell wall biosynthesis